MKIIQSFWSKGINNIQDNAGWYASKYHWLSWVLSCHQLVKFQKEVHLYTDALGKEILIDQLNLPYTKVHIILDTLNDYDKNLWAIGKIKTYQLQEEPFMHVDGDVFIWEGIDKTFKKSALLSQNLEITTDYYKSMWANIRPNLDFTPSDISKFDNGSNTYACNMGIVGGNDLSFFKEYCKSSFEFVNKNKRVWETAVAYNFNVFFEQVLFYEMASNRGIQIDVLLDEKTVDNSYKGFGDFDKVPEKKYLHLIGQYKRNQEVCKMMEIYVMKYYPESYSNLLKVMNADINLSSNLTQEKIENKIESFKNYIFKHFKFDNAEGYLLARDLFSEGIPLKYDAFLKSKIDFWIQKIEGFKKDDNNLIIEELNIEPTIYDYDDVDSLILDEIGVGKLKFSNLKDNMLKYVEDDSEELLTQFEILFKNRIRNYIKLKIITIFI